MEAPLWRCWLNGKTCYVQNGMLFVFKNSAQDTVCNNLAFRNMVVVFTCDIGHMIMEINAMILHFNLICV